MSKTKILCTGSGGFVFSNFVRYVLKNNSNYSIVGIDRCDNSNVLNTIYSNKGHNFYIGDVGDEHFLNVIFSLEKPDYVIHGATSYTDPIHVHVKGTHNIIESCISHNVKKLIYASSGGLYSGSSMVETDPIEPRTDYWASKAAGELFVKAASNRGLNYNIIRSCTNNYGPRQKGSKTVPLIVNSILNNRCLDININAMQNCDWLHVEDHCKAILKILEDGKKNEVYNIGAGQEFTNAEVLHEICNVLGRGHDLITFSGNVLDNCGNIVNFDKLKSIGWSPSIKFKNGIVGVINWYNNNLWFLR